MRGRLGGVWVIALLGPRTHEARTHRAPDCPAVRSTLRKEQQDRCGRCRSNLRGRKATALALCVDQDASATGDALTASGARRVGQIAYCIGQSNPRLAERIRYRAASGHQLLGQRAMEALSNREHEHCEQFRTLIQLLVEHLRDLGNKAAEPDGRIRAMHRTDPAGQLLETIPRSRAIHRFRAGSLNRQSPRLSRRPRTRCMAGSGPASALLG
jgi:hypothetical protein